MVAAALSVPRSNVMITPRLAGIVRLDLMLPSCAAGETRLTESQSLLDECAEWIAAQLEEENIFIDPGLVTLILAVERDSGPARAASATMATAIEIRLIEQGTVGVPDAINADLILAVLGWEDEFMALAGRPRLA